MQIVSCHFLDSDNDKLYDFINKCEFNISIGDKIWVKVGTGGSKLVIVRKIKNVEKENVPSGYKQVLEVVNMKYTHHPLSEGNIYVCDCRVWRNQRDADGGYRDQWSDLIVTCLFNDNLEIGSKVLIEGTKGKVVNIRQVLKVKTKKYGTAILDSNTTPTNNYKITHESNEIIYRKEKFYQKSWLTWLALILFWPVGIYLLWKYRDYEKSTKVIISVLTLILIMLIKSTLNLA